VNSERTVFFDPTTLAMLRNVLDDAWSRLPAGQTEITRSLLWQRIMRAAKAGERDPARLRARAIPTWRRPARGNTRDLISAPTRRSLERPPSEVRRG
jgi:hypothetical protein